VDDIAIHGVYPERPLRRFEPPPATALLGEEILESYTGVYEFAPKSTIEITRQGSRLFGQVAGQGKFEMFAEKDKRDEFFVRVVNARFRFLKDSTGAITALVLPPTQRPTTRAEDNKVGGEPQLLCALRMSSIRA
jgi:hypothetical protein